MKKTLSIACICVSSLISASVFAADNAAAELRTNLNNIPTLKANFTQVVTDVNNREIQTAKGQLALTTPNKLYWHLTSPDESLIVADGKDVWLYNPFAEEVTAMDMKNVISASPIALLVHRDENTWQDYQVTKSGDCYNIKPKAIDSQVIGVKVCFAHNTLTSLNIEDSQGNLSQFTLNDQQALTLDDKRLFTFKVPKGVDIDDQRTKTQ